ncbi:MAG: acyloxyacyl hydrolase [Burkholderiaceae bacterium]
MPFLSPRSRAACAALSFACASAPVQASPSWAPWNWRVLDPATWDTRCGGDRFVQARLAGPLHNFGDEGNQVSLALGACAATRGPLSLQFDAVLSGIDAFPHAGVGGGRALGVGVDGVLRWRLFDERRWFVEAGGGLQYAIGSSFPADGTHFQFTAIGGVGRTFELGAQRSLQVGVRWFHISNANLLPSNSGYDALQLVIGYSLDGRR